MARFSKTKKEEVGLSPDSLFFRGEIKNETTTLRIIDFDGKNLNQFKVEDINEISNSFFRNFYSSFFYYRSVRD